MLFKNSIFWVAPIFLLALGLVGYVHHNRPVPKHVIMIDAGSTGTRLFIYTLASSRIQCVHSLLNQDNTNGILMKKIEPGLYHYRDEPEKAALSLQPLLDFALRQIPGANYRSTPIYLRATGGLRSLPSQDVDVILQHIQKFLAKYPFKVADSHVSVISGAEEAVYGWISLNFLLEADRSIGALDMGGSSTQISMSKGSNKRASICNHNVQVLDQSHQVCALSLSGFGLEASLSTYKQAILDEAISRSATTVNSPCFAKGYTETFSVNELLNRTEPTTKNQKLTLVGSGDYDKCQSELLPVLLMKKAAADPEVSLLPALAEGNEFVAFNGFVTTHSALELKRRPTLKEWQESSRNFCKLEWQQVEKKSQPANRCFKAAWSLLLLNQVYGIGLDERRIDFVKDVRVGPDDIVKSSEPQNIDVSWTIGAVLTEIVAMRL
eukprot:TRINITY_DN17399_c0_g1_i1.p1 TRINITY_DN17399_c0_g1~~TRINITY_DN17399_c0_g1_i1.p1  ORF type:complete len:437 (-),score=57.62 TRINITY_DN17399_c0_g1_i1:82-1392(-)